MTRSAGALVHTPMPSRVNTRWMSSLASGSSNETSLGSASTTVTAVPKRANAWASSAPIAPPPRTIMDSGASSVCTISLFVQ